MADEERWVNKLFIDPELLPDDGFGLVQLLALVAVYGVCVIGCLAS